MENDPHHSLLTRIISSMVIITFSMFILNPTVLVAQVLQQRYQQTVAKSAQAEAVKLAHTLKTVETTLIEWQRRVSDNTRKHQTLDVKDEIGELKQQVLALDEQVQTDFAATENHLRAKKLSEEILQRHLKAVTTYRQNLTTLLNNFEDIKTAQDTPQLRTQIDKTLKHLQPLQTAGKHPKFDPRQLPFSIPKGESRAPLETEEALKGLFVSDSTLPPRSVVRRNPPQPDASYLAPTEDVQTTEDIKALAKELDHHPVKIYN